MLLYDCPRILDIGENEVGVAPTLRVNEATITRRVAQPPFDPGGM